MAQIDCTRCGAKAEMFLCPRCINLLRDWLKGMPRWIEFLTDAANGQTRLGQSARRSTDKGSPMLCNLPASELLAMVHSMLVAWVRDLCETRGIEPPSLTTPVDMTNWLGGRVSAIANHPGADEFCDELEQHIKAIERCINRPLPPIELGRCPTLLTDGNGQSQCQQSLSVRSGDIQIQCAGCGTTHTVEQLINHQLNDIPNRLFTSAEVFRIMERLQEPVNSRTWRHWRATGKIAPAGELYGEPAYRLDDVRKLRRSRRAYMATRLTSV